MGFGNRARTALLLGIIIASSRSAHAHGHHNSHIPKGQTVSSDPIVRGTTQPFSSLTKDRMVYYGFTSLCRCLPTASHFPSGLFWE